MMPVSPSRDHSPHHQRNPAEDTLSDDALTQFLGTLSAIEKLPSEIIDQILSSLSAQDLARVSLTCRSLAHHAANDLLWSNLVNSHLPTPIKDPGIFSSFRRLYLAHLPIWFIPQHKIWFGDHRETGSLVIARYDNRRGVIEGYRLLADRGRGTFQMWQSNPEVIIPSFDPTVHLWLDDAVILHRDENPTSPTAPCQQAGWVSERQMSSSPNSTSLFAALLLFQKENVSNKHFEEEEETGRPGKVWPPHIIPSDYRVTHPWNSNQPRPKCLAEVSQHFFCTRRWTHYQHGATMGPEIRHTYATLDESLYTPTKEKPYQGIWVGDYSAHGCEFLLFLQRSPAEEEHSERSEQDSTGNVVDGGSLEAIKLTGDPNVPRCTRSFWTDDIGPNGLLRVDTQEPFKNARIVQSWGQVAGIGFQNRTNIKTELILISHDCVAHYWVGLGHVTYYRRVDIDSLIS